ncbi:MAG: ATP-binding protein [Nitriliruptor sp.]
MIDRTHGYVAGLSAAAVAVLSAGAAATPFPSPDLVEILLLVGAIAIAERTEVLFRWDRDESGTFTLVEVAVAAGLLLLPPLHVAIAAIPGIALAHAASLRNPEKVAFNVASVTLAVAAAAGTLSATPAVGPLVADRPVLGLVLGMLAYGLISTASFAGLLWVRLPDRSWVTTLRRQMPLHAAANVAMTSVAIVLATLWLLRPDLVPFVLAPAVAVHLAVRSSLRAAALYGEQEDEHARLLRVVDGASDGIVLLDAHACIQVWNPAMTRLTGHPADDAVGRSVADVLTPAVRGSSSPATGRWTLEAAQEHTPVLEQDAQLTDADGDTRDVRESHAFTFDDRGRCTGAVVVVRDVSRQRELERLRSDFVARVSHELRSPLTPIRGFASVLLRRGELLGEEQRAEALTRIVERADHLHKLVEDLLLVTRIEHTDIAELVHAGPFDLARTVRSAVDHVRIADAGRTITVAVADDLPLAHADADRARQVIDALLDNAVRYSQPDTPVEVELDRDGVDVRVRVVDHGPGIPAAQRDAVFERFHRLEDPMTMRTGGVGVGLFLGRRLAEAMHGSLTIVDTPPGDGAVLELRLPVAAPEPASGRREWAVDTSPPAVPDLPR